MFSQHQLSQSCNNNLHAIIIQYFLNLLIYCLLLRVFSNRLSQFEERNPWKCLDKPTVIELKTKRLLQPAAGLSTFGILTYLSLKTIPTNSGKRILIHDHGRTILVYFPSWLSPFFRFVIFQYMKPTKVYYVLWMRSINLILRLA